ncbi:MAG: transcriptional regulator, TetR family [Acidimicrobiales bacterium]|nr:transcriptional regulator, TetR family [Acidimicrobiales bacterium]
MSRKVGTSPRPYDARKRRERAGAERDATRRKVVEAAAALFTERGYRATTVAAIAERAGVALQSVYKAGGSKAELLHLAADLAVSGDHEATLMVQRPAVADVAAEPDPHRQLQLIAAFVADVTDRALPILAAEREAAAFDPRAAADLEATRLRRHDTFRGLAALIPSDALQPGLTADDVVDTLWAVASPEVCLLLRSSRGWTKDRFESWLATVLPRLLLADPAG